MSCLEEKKGTSRQYDGMGVKRDKNPSMGHLLLPQACLASLQNKAEEYSKPAATFLEHLLHAGFFF